MSQKNRLSNMMARRASGKLKQSIKRKSKKPTVSLAIKNYVKKTVAVNVENKTANANYAGLFGNATANASLYCYPMTPYTGYMTIGQGVQQNQRIGNTVKVKRAMLRYVLRPNSYDVSTNPIPAPVQVELYLGRTRLCSGDQPVAADMNVLYQNGNTSFGPVGNLNDIVSEINHDYWTIKKRWTHKVGYASSSGSGGSLSNQYYSNNDFQLNVIKKLDITKYYPKILKFNDGTNQVQGPGLFLFYQCLNAGGTTNGSTVLPCHMTFWIDVTYEDA